MLLHVLNLKNPTTLLFLDQPEGGEQMPEWRESHNFQTVWWPEIPVRMQLKIFNAIVQLTLTTVIGIYNYSRNIIVWSLS